MTLPTIASLWIGGDLSYLEQLCLKSFADYGHRTILYTYGDVGGAPKGVEVLDANAIFPASDYITHKKSGSPAIHADVFRYKMIQMQNVIWVDADVLCMQPWDFKGQFVFGWEKTNRLVCNAVLGLPRFSRTLEALNEFCADEHPIPPWFPDDKKSELVAAKEAGAPVHMSELDWGVSGPAALTHFLNASGEMAHVMPQMAFFPISFKQRRMLLQKGHAVEDLLDGGCYGVHLWNRRLKRRIVTNEQGVPLRDCFLGRALLRHQINPYAAPLPDDPPPGFPTQAELRAQKAKEDGLDEAPMIIIDPERIQPGEIKEGAGFAVDVGGRHKGAEPSAAAPQQADRESLLSEARAHKKAEEAIGARIAQLPPVATGRVRLSGLSYANSESEEAIKSLENRTTKFTDWLDLPSEPIPDDKIVIVTSMKNEGPFILEWIAYHLAIGATHFLVYTNDCSDPTNEILDRLSELGIVTRLDNPYKKETGEKPQHGALKNAITQPVVKAADWVLTIDVDEFVNIHVGNGTFKELFAACNYPNVVSFTWKFFGSKDQDLYKDKLITESFVHCAPEFIPKPRLGWGFKSMMARSAPYEKIGVHRPLDPVLERIGEARWVNGSGRVMPEMLLDNNGWRSTKRSVGYRLATLNHYVLRSAQSYLVKRERGRINHTDQDQGVDYWMRRNYRSERDERMKERLPMLKASLAQLLADQRLADLHEAAVSWHKGRIEALMKDPDYHKLYEMITDRTAPDALEIGKEKADEEEGIEPVEHLEKPSLLGPLEAELRHPVCPESGVLGGGRHDRFTRAAGVALEAGGFLWEGEESAFMFVPKSRRLVISFDNLSVVRGAEHRSPWGMKVITEVMGCSLLGVMAVNRHWFRDAFSHDVFDRLRESGFFDQFDDILFYGASMGGYAALTFARAAPGSNVLAITPQTTLDRRILPDDNRWGWTANLDWDGAYADAVEGAKTAKNIFVISDPYMPEDQAQIARLKGVNYHHLRAAFMGHQIAGSFGRMGILKDMLFAAADGRLNAQLFSRLFRARKNLARYQHDLLMHAEARGKIKSAIRVCEYTLSKRKAGNIERSLARLREELAAAEAGMHKGE